MQSLGKFQVNPSISPLSKGGLREVFGLGITLLLLLAVACGAAATATPAPAKAPQPAAAQPAAPVAKPAAIPTATPVPKPIPVPAAVSPGKVTWMVGSFCNERFDYTYGGATCHDYAKVMHGFLISSDVEGGRRVAVPGIATKWQISSDGLRWTFTIREGIKFHDGTDLTAKDVLWTLQHIMGPQAVEYGGSGPIALAKNMDRIEQTGPNEVSLFTKGIAPEIPERVGEAGGGWYGAVFPKRAVPHDEKVALAYDRNPIGAGPMRLVKHVPADSMTFERFADFYYQPKYGLPKDKRVNFTVLDLRLVPEEATRISALRAGEADIAPVSITARKQVEAGGGRVVFGQEGVAFHIIQLGCWRPQFPCSKKGVRQALNYAIDKELMRDRLYGGPEVMQVKGWVYVTPSTSGYSPELAPYPFDPVKARQLLTDAGYPGGKGFGKLIINPYVTPSLPLMPEAAQLVAEFWKRELGLDVEVKVGDQAALSKARLTPDLHGQIWWRDNETRLDAAGNVRVFWGTKGPGQMHEDPELFALVKQAIGVFDPVEQEKSLNSLYRRLRDEAQWIPLGYLNIPWGVGPRIRTWEPYPVASYPSALHTITLK